MLDGREVSETERQFLLNWKTMRRARRKQQRLAQRYLQKQNAIDPANVIPTAQQILSSQPAPPLTMPALPARQLPRRTKRPPHQQPQTQDPGLPALASYNVVAMHQGMSVLEPIEEQGIRLPEIVSKYTGVTNTSHMAPMLDSLSPVKDHSSYVLSHRTLNIASSSDAVRS